MLHHALFQFYETKARRQRRATAPGNRFEAGDVPVDAGRFSVWCETLAPNTSVDSQEASRAIPHPLDAQRFLAAVAPRLVGEKFAIARVETEQCFEVSTIGTCRPAGGSASLYFNW